MTGLADSVHASIGSESAPLCWPGLAEQLVAHVFRGREDEVEAYSTTASMTGGLKMAHQERVVCSSGHPQVRTVVEVLPEGLEHHFEISGCRFLRTEEIERDGTVEMLVGALDEVVAVGGFAGMLGPLIRRVHLMMPDDAAYDINFSDPALPFSIFVSVQSLAPESFRWRLAEALVHEAGHLQLSLVERVVPLVTETSATFHAPWRGTQRPLGGVLHGLYVFGLIAEWMSRSGASPRLIQRRLAEICQDVDALRDFPEARGLTPSGAALARSICTRLDGLLV